MAVSTNQVITNNQPEKPKLSFWQIWNMSFGFLGIQYGFGLQQANMSPIYRYLGAEESALPYLWLAGPITGLLVQPIIGAMSDKTWSKRWGRRRPYFIIGAILASIALVAMPYSHTLWMAAGLLWLLDSAQNIAMEPFRAFVADKLSTEQRPTGFAVQSFMVGLGQTLASFMPQVLTLLGFATIAAKGVIPDFVKFAFIFGAVVMLAAIFWTVFTTDEYPPSEEELLQMRSEKVNIFDGFKEVYIAFKEMPFTMKQLWWVMFFTWYGLPMMWQYLSLSIAKHCFNAPTPDSPGFDDGVRWGGTGQGLFSIACMIIAIVLPTIAKRIGNNITHAVCLTFGGLGFISMYFTNQVSMIMVAMFFVGIAWGSIMTMPYVILSDSVPPKRMGVYMGIFNMFIVIPILLQMLTLPWYYSTIGGDPLHALVLAGICFLLAAVCTLFVKCRK
ncbi:MAG: MFS transporter [Saprospiraceae bacterium]|nr:MFS transporter [Saprospiraceae bacterium]MBP7699007.1 MFS transporter [Saprospiraceae bacterium]